VFSSTHLGKKATPGESRKFLWVGEFDRRKGRGRSTRGVYIWRVEAAGGPIFTITITNKTIVLVIYPSQDKKKKLGNLAIHPINPSLEKGAGHMCREGKDQEDMEKGDINVRGGGCK